MKTSYILLAIIAIVTLTGMIATDVLLKQQYDGIDWKNAYQDFKKQPLPTAKHWVIEGTPTDEILILKRAHKAQALIEPEAMKFYRVRQQGDTAFVLFTPDYSGYQNDPRNSAYYELRVRLVLELPDLKTLRVDKARLTVRDFATDSLTVELTNTRLRTQKLAVSNAFTILASHNSFAVLGADHYTSLKAIVRDSSGVQLNNTQAGFFAKEVSPKAEVQLRGQALKWLR